MTLPQTGLQYLVAFNNGPLDDPALITTVASPPGTLGGANVWTDITRFVLSDSGQRGRQQEFASVEAATRELHLNNRDGRFTPWNTSSPYTGLVNPRKLVQVREVWAGVTYYRLTGHANAWNVEWPDESSQTVTLHVADAFRLFNGWNLTSAGYPAQVVADGAAQYWRLGDPAGSTIAYDTATAGYDGHYLGTYTLGSSGAMPVDPNTSVNLGSATGYATVPPPAGPLNPGSSNYSIEAWISVAAYPASVAEIYSTNDAGLSKTDLILNSSGTLALQFADPGGIFQTATTTATIPADGSSHHVVATFTAGGFGNRGTIALYVDGSLQTVSTANNGVPGQFSPVSAGIGGRAGGAGGTGATFSGSVQDVAFYPSALSAGTVSTHFLLGAIPQQSTDARLARGLNIIGWSAGARNLDAGTSTVQAVTSSLVTTSALSHFQQVEATEAGALFMTVDGKVRFISRQNLFSQAAYTTSRATLGDNTAGGDIPFLPGPNIARDDIFLYNVASAQRTGGNRQTTTGPSAATNGPTTWQPPANLIGVSDVEVLELTQYVVAKYATPVDRLTSITVDLVSLAASFPAVVPTFLSLDLMQRITVERTLMPAGGTAFSQVSQIEHISETINPTQWFVTFQLAIADPAFWVLGTSQLGVSTRLAF